MVEVEGVEPSSEKVSAKVTTSVSYMLIFTRELALGGAYLKIVCESFSHLSHKQGRRVSGNLTPDLKTTGGSLRGDAAVIY